MLVPTTEKGAFTVFVEPPVFPKHDPKISSFGTSVVSVLEVIVTGEALFPRVAVVLSFAK